MLRTIGCLACGVLAGCSSKPPEKFTRAAIAGVVTLDGAPLAAGDVTFIPLMGGAMAGAKIVDGKFKLGTTDGPSIGPNRVEIRSVQPTGRLIDSPVTPEGDGAPGANKVMEHKELVPKRYNNESELKFDVQPDVVNDAEFKLESASGKK